MKAIWFIIAITSTPVDGGLLLQLGRTCPSSLQHLASAIPRFNNPKLSEVRDAILQADLRAVEAAIQGQGLSLEAALQQVETSNAQILAARNQSRQCAAEAGAFDKAQFERIMDQRAYDTPIASRSGAANTTTIRAIVESSSQASMLGSCVATAIVYDMNYLAGQETLAALRCRGGLSGGSNAPELAGSSSQSGGRKLAEAATPVMSTLWDRAAESSKNTLKPTDAAAAAARVAPISPDLISLRTRGQLGGDVDSTLLIDSILNASASASPSIDPDRLDPVAERGTVASFVPVELEAYGSSGQTTALNVGCAKNVRIYTPGGIVIPSGVRVVAKVEISDANDTHLNRDKCARVLVAVRLGLNSKLGRSSRQERLDLSLPDGGSAELTATFDLAQGTTLASVTIDSVTCKLCAGTRSGPTISQEACATIGSTLVTESRRVLAKQEEYRSGVADLKRLAAELAVEGEASTGWLVEAITKLNLATSVVQTMGAVGRLPTAAATSSQPVGSAVLQGLDVVGTSIDAYKKKVNDELTASDSFIVAQHAQRWLGILAESAAVVSGVRGIKGAIEDIQALKAARRTVASSARQLQVSIFGFEQEMLRTRARLAEVSGELSRLSQGCWSQ